MRTLPLTNDADLWEQVLAGNTTAFEQVVAKYQNAVSAISYSQIGDFSTSEDISQETFLVAWQARDTLKDFERLRSWLCGIARNLANNHLRNAGKRKENAVLDGATASPSVESEVESRAVAEEEQALVWSTLGTIDKTYREPLVLHYREGATVKQIAAALEISEDAAKQRLSRGRNMLRDSVAVLVDRALEVSRPGKKFTASVMTAIGSTSLITKSASAASTAIGTTTTIAKAGSAAASMGAAGGLAGALLGTLGGLGGAWIGTWAPAQMAPTLEERMLLTKAGKKMFSLSIVFTVGILLLTPLALIQGLLWLYIALLALGSAVFITVVTTQSVRTQGQVKQLRAEIGEAGHPNESALKTWMGGSARWKGRSYQSSARLLGLPLIDIQMSDIDFTPSLGSSSPKRARGWIAVGDKADGLLLAIGGIARGFIAIGGIAFGGISIGGLGVGLISLSGLALGGLAVGGLAIGYDALGGLALAWHCAAGGGAIAYHAAIGGGALAVEYAVGGGAAAMEANTDIARAHLDQQFAGRALKAIEGWEWLPLLFLPLAFILPFLSRFLYVKEETK